MKPITLALLLGLALAACHPAAPVSSASTPAPAPKTAVLLGGSGEPGQDNFLVHDIRDLARALGSRGWVIRAAVGSKDGILAGSRRATNANLLAAASEALGAARSGDEVLVLIHDHGSERESTWGQKSHTIASEEASGFDMDRLEAPIRQARQRGVRVALVDLSCYSAATLALSGANCTVALASTRYVSLCSGRPEDRVFNSLFFALPAGAKPIPLQDWFLRARRSDSDSINLPQISSIRTPGAAAWDKFLVQTDPLDVYEDLYNLRTGTPSFDPALLTQELAEVSRATGDAELKLLQSRISAALERAVGLRKQLEKAMPALAKDYDVASLKVGVSGSTPIAFAPADLAEALGDIKAPDDRSDAEASLMARLAPEKRRIEAENVKALGDFLARRQRFDSLSDELERAGEELFALERKFYDRYVEVAGGSHDAGCEEFLL